MSATAPSISSATSASLRHRARAQRGAGIVEIMVGLLIGMLVILAVTSIFANAEGYRRTAAAMADAQVTGLLTQFTLVRDIQSSGSSITSANKELTPCADPTLRPIPVLITDGGVASDSFVVFGGSAARVVHPVNTIAATPIGSAVRVQSPTGFEPAFCSAGTPCEVIIMEGANCELRLATSAVDLVPGARQLTMAPALGNNYTSNAKVMNLGHNGTVMRTNYDVVANVLRSQDLITMPGPNPVNPVASNVFMMKAQYGVDTTAVADGSVDCWTAADNSNTCGNGIDYSAASVQNLPTSQLTRIVAVRLGIVVQSDEYDKAITAASTTWLFNCSANTNAACQGRYQVNLPANWRFRTYETVIPLRNAEWNTQ